MLAVSHKRLAFSLVEVLTAVAIFSMVVLLVFGSFRLALQLTKTARETSIAANLAEEMMDGIRATPFDQIVINTAPAATATSKLPAGFTKTYVSLYQGNDKIKEVTITVYWSSRPESRAISLTTLVSLGGVSLGEAAEASGVNVN